MKFITIIYVLFSCATILAASDKNYCDTYLSNHEYQAPLYGEKWKINNDGTLKMIDKTPTPTINEGTLNALVYSYSEKGNVVVINSAQGNFRGPTDKEQIVFKLDSNKKILSMQFGTHQYEDSYRYHRTILFDNKNGICYPQLALEGALDINPVTKSYDDNSPIDGIINNSIYFNTELCRDLNAYINNEKNKDTVMKCSCGTSQSNKILTAGLLAPFCHIALGKNLGLQNKILAKEKKLLIKLKK